MATSGENEQMLTKYLLNDVSEEERERIEEQLFIDRDFFEQVETAEMRLVDRYVLGEMSADEKARFISGYLPVPEHARRVREAQQFHAQLKNFGSACGDDTGEIDSGGPAPFSRAARFGTLAFVVLSLLAIGSFVGTGALLRTRQRVNLVINDNANQILTVRAKLSSPQPTAKQSPTAMLASEHDVAAAGDREYVPHPGCSYP